VIKSFEGRIWNDECLVEKYQEQLQSVYVKAVGYQGAGYWFMAGAAIRREALLRAVDLWT
jgi:hypothetical protein